MATLNFWKIITERYFCVREGHTIICAARNVESVDTRLLNQQFTAIKRVSKTRTSDLIILQIS